VRLEKERSDFLSLSANAGVELSSLDGLRTAHHLGERVLIQSNWFLLNSMVGTERRGGRAPGNCRDQDGIA